MNNDPNTDKEIPEAVQSADSSEPPSPIKLLHNTWKTQLAKGYRSSLLIKIIPPKGLGVFADRDYAEGDALEYCHCIVSDWKAKYIHEPSYKRYAYWENCSCEDCKRHGNRGLILLGAGSIINSVEKEDQRNVHVEIQAKLQLAVVVAVKNIKKNEELLAWHGENYFNSWCKPNIDEYAKRMMRRRKALEAQKLQTPEK